jgi:hypothetical protein
MILSGLGNPEESISLLAVQKGSFDVDGDPLK